MSDRNHSVKSLYFFFCSNLLLNVFINSFRTLYICVRAHSDRNLQGLPGRGREVIGNGGLREMEIAT